MAYINGCNIVIKMIPHNIARSKVCLLCFKKTDILKEPKLSISKHPDLIKIIAEHILDGFDNTDERLPNAFCKSCYNRLCDMNNAESNRTIANVFIDRINEYAKTQRRISPRTNDCDCQICLVANANGLVYKRLLSRNKTSSSPSTDHVARRLCCTCLSEIYRGCSHSCNLTTLLSNIKRVAPETTLQRVASDTIKELTTLEQSIKVSFYHTL